MSDRPRCSCHDWPLTRQRNADGSYRWRCMRRQQLKRKAERAGTKSSVGTNANQSSVVRTWRREANDHDALDALRWQHPRLTDDELRGELQQQRALARSGQLAP